MQMDHLVPEYRQYTKTDLFLNPTDPEMPYRRRKDEEKKSIHFGQRKLLLTLVQFLTLFWDPQEIPKPVVVYAGAAPGTNIAIVSMLFPEVEFHLYDPAPFKIKPTEKLRLYQQYFRDDDAKKWADRTDVFFVSDIRTADYTKAKNLDENEAQIMIDMNMQMDWFNIINPIQGQLKFRPPYTGGNRPPRIDYLMGYVFKQAWGPKTTTETRLVPIRGDEGRWIIVSWSAQKYQDQMFHHNVVIREKYNYVNPFDNTTNPIDSPELLNDWDSRTEAQIWIDYLVKRTGASNKQSLVALSRLVTKKLTEGSRYKNTLHLLRSNPQFIKHRNIRPSRDDRDDRDDRDTEGWKKRTPLKIKTDKPIVGNCATPSIVQSQPAVVHLTPTITPSSVGLSTKPASTSKLATDIGL